jgi:integrase
MWQLKKEGYADSTLKAYDSRLRMLAKSVDLDDPEAIKTHIASRNSWSNVFKEGVAKAYNNYVKYNGLSWNKPRYGYSKKLPYIATTEQINKIISNCRKKYALILSVLRDTGLRPIELHHLTLRDIDLEKGVISVSSAKEGNPRCLKLASSTLAMLKDYVVQYDFSLDDKIFPTPEAMRKIYCRTRRHLAKKLHEPELMKIRLYDFRHYFATMLYHKTKDILYVKEQLGHKRIETTLIYTHLIRFSDEEYVSAVAKTVDNARKLIEAGFEYVIQIDDSKIFRKRK